MTCHPRSTACFYSWREPDTLYCALIEQRLQSADIRTGDPVRLAVRRDFLQAYESTQIS
jgi:hypothetical protein